MIRTSLNIGGQAISDHDFTRIHLRQSLGQHNDFEIGMRQDAAKGLLADRIKSWIGEPVTIGFDHEHDAKIESSPVTEVFKGVITSIGLSRKAGTAEIVLRGESPTILMDDAPHTQSFTDCKLTEVIDKVIQPYSGAFSKNPQVSPERFNGTLAYTVQYKETPFDFIGRLAHQFGEWFYYDGLELICGTRPKGKPVQMDFGSSDLESFDLSVASLAHGFEIGAFDYEASKPTKAKGPKKAASNDIGEQAIAKARKMYKEKPLIFLQKHLTADEVKFIAQRREEVALDETVILNGSSMNSSLRLGGTVEISDELGEGFGEFIVTELHHSIGQAGGYSNRFKAIPIETEVPPVTRMARSPQCEMQLADVVEVADEQGLGRIKVKFFWQQDTSETSPWLRVTSPYTGKDKGFYLIPEIDDRVLVAFEANNPEKPYVLSGMYEKKHTPEWFSEENDYKGFKSKGNNEWKFDDKNQSIEVHAPNEILMTAGKRIHLKTGFKDEKGKKDSEINIDVADGTVNITAKVVNVKAAETVEIESGKTIKEKAGQTYTMEAGKDMKSKAGANLEMKGMNVKSEASTSHESKGTLVKVEGGSITEIKGAIVKLN